MSLATIWSLLNQNINLRSYYDTFISSECKYCFEQARGNCSLFKSKVNRNDISDCFDGFY